MKYLVICLATLLNVSFAQEISSSHLLQQLETHQKQFNKRLSSETDSHVVFEKKLLTEPVVNENSPCLPVKTLTIESSDDKLFQPSAHYLIELLSSLNITVVSQQHQQFFLRQSEHLEKPPCLSSELIEKIVVSLQNELIGKGFITSRILTPEQSLNQGNFTISIATGKIAQIRIKDNPAMNSHRANLYNAFPTASGDLLNLRELEQGLENLRRLPTVSAQMEIGAGSELNTSNIDIKWQQKALPVRLNLSLDDSGSKSTGKYLGTLALSWDNPLHINDILDVSYTKNLKPGVKLSNPQGGKDKSGTNNYSIGYSLPWRYWQFDVGTSNYFYDQIVVGSNRNYHYSGDSTQNNLSISRVMYRDDRHKTTLRAGLWQKSTKSYIDDAEIEVQRRRTGGWKASLSQRSYLSKGTLTTALNYKVGTRAFGAIPAPEEQFHEGTAKAKIWTADLSWNMPFRLNEQTFSWSSQLHSQYSNSKLTSQDKLSIGGRFSVRGFTGERSLSAEKGGYLKNTLSWHYNPSHQAYLGIDMGKVFGDSAKQLAGNALAGGIIGFRGQLQHRGYWNYDIFAGTPIKEPKNFDTDNIVMGFNLSYSL